jgi:hypothetical protein
MAKLKAALAAIQKGLGITEGLRDVAVNRMKARHKGQKTAERQAEAARDAAHKLSGEAAKYLRYDSKQDVARGSALLRKSQRKSNKALRLDAKAEKEKARAIVLKGRARKLTQRLEGIETDIKAAEAALAKWEKTHGPHVGKNGKVAGADTPREAAIWVAKYIWQECAANHRPNYYSMTGGGFNCKHGISKGSQKAIGQVPYERSDCSLFVTEVCYAAGLTDPNGTNWTSGFTGSLVGQHNGWRQVSEAEMRKKGWGFVVYGGGDGHHTEFYVGEGGDTTIGHGSAPVDPGVIALFGDSDYRCYVWTAA